VFSFFKAFFDCFSGFSLLFKPGIKRFVVIPFLINAGLFYLAIDLLRSQMDRWLEKLLPGWLSWLEWLIVPLFWVAILLIVFYTFTVIANLVAAPFNSLLSSRIEAMLTGKKPEDINSDGFFKLTIRTIKSEIQKILYLIKWFIPLIIITLIPVVNLAAPFLWILFAIWFFALGYNEYPLANRGCFFEQVKVYNRKNRMSSLGLGSAVFIMTSIPFVNFLAMPIAIAGATKLTSRIDQKDKAAQ